MKIGKSAGSLPAVLVHVALLIILSGFVLSWRTAEYGYIHLRAGEGFAATWRTDAGLVRPLPFKIRLDSLSASRGGISGGVTLVQNGETEVCGISIGRHIARGGYYFLLRNVDYDSGGVSLFVASDTIGRPVVYIGYALLMAGLCGCMLRRRSRRMPAGAARTVSTRRFIVVAAALAEVALLVMLVLRALSLGAFPAADLCDTLMLCGAFAFVLAIVLAYREIVLSSAAIGIGIISALAALAVPRSAYAIMPVLDNPLLGLHVCLVMTAYVLFALMAISSALCLAGFKSGRILSAGTCGTRMLLPALTSLAGGIIVGSVWAAGAWGRYWSWDPKETWALLTMLVYALPVHISRLRFMRRRLALQVYFLLAFLIVLFTWFGVPYLFAGMHSYL